VAEPILRAADSTGEVYDDPSEDLLFELMGDLRSVGQSIRVARLEELRQDEWARVTLNEHRLYVFESSERLRYVSSLRTIHDFLTRWAFDLFDGE